MATIVTRSGKGSPLTNTEVDANFTNLNTELGTKANTSSLATVATSGAYSDLTGKPTNVSSFANDSGYITGITSSNVTTALGYTPANRAGDTFTGPITVNSGANQAILGSDGAIELTRGAGGAYIDFKDSTAEDFDVRLQASGNQLNISAAGGLTLNGAGVLTGITSGQVTTALGYTPYNATNPAGYITSAGSISGNAATATNISNTGTVTLASATESNSIYATAPSYTADQPTKLLNFDWYGNVFSLGNIRSGSTPSSGFGVYYTPSGGSRAELMRVDTSGNVLINRTSASGIGKLNVEGGVDVTSGNVTVQAGYGIAWRGDQSRIMTPDDNSYGALIRWGATGGCRLFESTTERLRIDGTGSVTAFVDVRAPIFYDSPNSAYYLDPAGTSNLNQINLGDSTKFIRGGASGQTIIGVGGVNEAYLQVGGSYYSIWNAGNFNPASYLPLSGGTLTGDLGITKGAPAIVFTSTTSGRAASFGMTDGYNMYLNAPTNGVLFLSEFRAPLMRDTDNSAYYINAADTSVLNNLSVNGGTVFRSDWTTRFQSTSDFVDGTLVTTDIPATAWAGDSFVIEITGKTYDQNNPPVKVIAQGYLYNDTIINYSGISYAGNFATYIKVFQDGGVLKFWWPRISYWNSFNVNVMAMDGPTNNTITRNRVTAIANSTEPTGTKKQQINLTKTLKTGDAAGSISGFNNPTTAPTANTIVYRDAAGDISAREIVLSSGLSAQTPTVLVSMYPSTNQLVRTTPAAVAAAIQGAASGAWGINVTGKANDLNQARYANTDFNTLGATPEVFRAYSNYIPSGGSYNQPTSAGDFKVIQWGGIEGVAGNWGGQIVQNFYDDRMWFRRSQGTTWQAWREFIHDGNYTNYAMPSGSLATNTVEVRAPIFRDNINTGYFIDPDGNSNLSQLMTTGAVVIGGNFTNNGYNSVASTRLLFGGGNEPDTYFIGTNLENYGGNYSKLDLRWHTGIRMGARPNYGGIRFYNDETLATQIFAIGKDGSYAQANQSMRAPIFQDLDNTEYYLDPFSTGLALKVNGNMECFARSAAWSEGYRVRVPSRATWGGIRFTRDDANSNGNWAIGFTGIDSTDDLTFWGNLNGAEGMRARLTQTGNFSITGASVAYSYQGNGNVGGTGSASWHPSGIYSAGYNWLYGGIAAGGGDITGVNAVYAAAYYDSPNTAFYVDPASTSNISSLTVANRINGSISGDAQRLFNHTGANNDGLQFWNTVGNDTLNPNTGWHYALRLAHGDADTYYNATLAVDFFADNVYLRRKTGGSNQPWKRFALYDNVYEAIFYASSFSDANNTAFYLDPNNTGTSLNVAGSIIAAGNVTAYSDRRLKNNIQQMTSALDKVSQLLGVTFTRNDLADTTRRYGGLLAQDVEKVLPEAVHDIGGTLGVDYNATIGLLVEAIKELRTEVEMLRK